MSNSPATHPTIWQSLYLTAKWVLEFMWSLFMAVVVVGGLLAVMYFVGGREAIDWVKAHNWEENACTVAHARVISYEEGTGSDTTVKFQLDTVYHYVVDGKKYAGTRYDFSLGASSSSKHAVKAKRFLKANPSLTCYFNPKHPDQSVVDRGLQFGMLFMLIPGVLLLLFGTMAVGGLWRKLTGNKRRPHYG